MATHVESDHFAGPEAVPAAPLPGEPATTRFEIDSASEVAPWVPGSPPLDGSDDLQQERLRPLREIEEPIGGVDQLLGGRLLERHHLDAHALVTEV